jgi:hypothetical protein
MVDWTKPIEAVHEDGRVVSASFQGGVASDGYLWVYGDFHDGLGHWFSQKGRASHTPYHIRNVETAKPAISDDLVERMVALVRQLQSNYCMSVPPEVFSEAAAIVAELPQPTDPAIAEARRLCREFMMGAHGTEGLEDGDLDHTPLMQTMIKAVRWGWEGV